MSKSSKPLAINSNHQLDSFMPHYLTTIPANKDTKLKEYYRKKRKNTVKN